MAKPKSLERLELEKYNILELLKNQNMYEIADRFNCNYSTVNRVAEEQVRLLEINKFEASKEKIEFTGTKGAWAELKSTQLYKKIMYERGN